MDVLRLEAILEFRRQLRYGRTFDASH